MIKKDAILIDELPAGSKLYYRTDGSLLILCGSDAGSRQMYAISPQRNLKNRSCRVEMWSRDKNRMINIETSVESCRIPENDDAVSTLQTMFPSLCETTLTYIDDMGDDMAWELAACMEAHPKIYSAGYPISYIALLLWQEGGKEILGTIEQKGGFITTQHLCHAAGVARLTPGMKKFIRMVKPTLCKLMHMQRLCSVLQRWDEYHNVFQHSDGAQLDTIQLDEICRCLDLHPILARCKWFRANALYNSCGYLDWEEWIQPAYDFYKENLTARGKPLPEAASSLSRFLTHHIRSHKQLDKLVCHASVYVTDHSDSWLAETYPDDYRFENLPPIRASNPFRMLRTAGQLREMATRLKNCAATHLDAAATGAVIFFAYEYSPEDNLHRLPHSPDHPVDGLLALRRDCLDEWLQTGTAPDWSVIQQKLVLQFKGFGNSELGQHAWNDLEGFFRFHVYGRYQLINLH